MANGSRKAACRVELALQVVECSAVGVVCIVCQLHGEVNSSTSSSNHGVDQQPVLKLGQHIQQPLPTSCSRVLRMSAYCIKPHMLLPHLLCRSQSQGGSISFQFITRASLVAYALGSTDCGLSSPQTDLDPLPTVDVLSCKPPLKLHSSMSTERCVLRLIDSHSRTNHAVHWFSHAQPVRCAAICACSRDPQ